MVTILDTIEIGFSNVLMMYTHSQMYVYKTGSHNVTLSTILLIWYALKCITECSGTRHDKIDKILNDFAVVVKDSHQDMTQHVRQSKQGSENSLY
jgi:hypothetical protein